MPVLIGTKIKMRICNWTDLNLNKLNLHLVKKTNYLQRRKRRRRDLLLNYCLTAVWSEVKFKKEELLLVRPYTKVDLQQVKTFIKVVQAQAKTFIRVVQSQVNQSKKEYLVHFKRQKDLLFAKESQDYFPRKIPKF